VNARRRRTEREQDGLAGGQRTRNTPGDGALAALDDGAEYVREHTRRHRGSALVQELPPERVEGRAEVAQQCR
jgi:hypothetical protein